MKRYVLILAAGEGKRMNAELPKQFIGLKGKPLLMHTFGAFCLFDDMEFVLVLNEHWIDTWKQLCQNHHFSIPHQVVEGGPMRFHSVKSGLKYIPDGALVAIHDGARPLVSKETIGRCFEMAVKKGNAVPTMSISESVREIDGALNRPVNRDKIKIVQTPQVFHSSFIRKAYNQPYNEKFTDDATVLESIGEQIHLVEGNPENFKITTVNDLIVAERLMDNWSFDT